MKTKSEIEALAKAYIKTLPAVNYKSLYDFGTQNMTAFNAGYTACQDEDRWIPVSERLPTERGYYIAFISGREVVRPMWFEKYWMDSDSNYFHDNESYPVIAWQPLPKPPEK